MYDIVHFTLKCVFLISVVFPAIAFGTIIWYLCLPLGILSEAVFACRYEDFKDGLRDLYVIMPCDLWNCYFEEFSW